MAIETISADFLQSSLPWNLIEKGLNQLESDKFVAADIYSVEQYFPNFFARCNSQFTSLWNDA